MTAIPEVHALIQACLDGSSTPAEAERLNDLLRADPAARDAYLQAADLHACMAVDEQLWVEQPALTPADAAAAPRDGAVRPSRRPVAGLGRLLAMAAVAGVAVGLGGASLVFAYVTPLAWKPILLLDEGFERGPAPVSREEVLADGLWSGDHAEVVGAERGVKPRDGRGMLRMLRADYEGKQADDGYSADLYRLIDLHSHRDLIDAGNTRVRVLMPFNAFAFPAHEKYSGAVVIYALDEAGATGGPVRVATLGAEALAMARKSIGACDRNPATWQVAHHELRLPPGTTSVLVHLAVAHGSVAQRRESFEGHYLDGVRVQLELIPGEKPR